MSLAAKDFLFQLQLLVARAGSDLSLRKSLTADTLSALAANGLKPPAGASFEVTEDKTPCGVVKEGSRFCLNLPNVLDLNQITFSANQNAKLALSTPCNSEETVTETTAEIVETVATNDQVQTLATVDVLTPVTTDVATVMTGF
jgi:hypothetical protein